MTTIEKLRAKMNAATDPISRYLAAKELIEARRAAEAAGHAEPAPAVQPIQKQDPVAAYTAAKKRIAAKGGAPEDSPHAQPTPARKHSGGCRDWPPAHLRQRVADAQRRQ